MGSDGGSAAGSERELRESRDRLGLALDAARMGTWDWEVATGRLTWSGHLEEIHGMAPGSFDGTFECFMRAIHPGDRERVQAQIAMALEGGREFATEFRVVSHDGTLRWVAGEGRVVRDAAGRATGMIGVGHDITARRRAEEALRESEARFRAVADSAPVMIWQADREGRCTYLNSAWLRHTGRDLERELGEGWLESVHPDDRERRREAVARAAAGGEPFEVEYRLRRADGRYGWILDRGVPRRDPGGAVEGFIGSCVDFTERHDAEEADRLLADIGMVLDRPLALGDRLRDLARALLPRVADACVVDLFDEDGRLRRVAAAHVDPALTRVLESLPAPAEASPSGQVAAGGEPMLIEEVAEVHHRLATRDERELEARRSLATRSAVIVPLIARGRRIGALNLSTGRGHSDRPLGPRDLALAGQIAGRAALAIENARLFEAERAAADRVRFLAEASRLLSSSLDYSSTLRSLARLAVPRLGDWCAVHLADERGRPRPVAVEHADPEKVRWAQELTRRYPPRDDAPTGVPAVVRSGRPEILSRIPDEMLAAAAQDDEHLRLLREVGLTSYLCVPLKARGRSIGALSLVTTVESGRRYAEADLALAEELAERAGLAIDNARLFQAQRHIAATLQRALLPGSLPDIPGAEVGAAYLAMGEGVEAGGDFYDVFASGAGGWSLVVGDVCGKGPEAAALTAMARYTLRTLARVSPDPARLLLALNDEVLRQRPGNTRFLTACLALARAEGGRVIVRLAAAAHPPPLVARADGRVEWPDLGGGLVGILPRIEVASRDVELAPGDRLVLYTDGVTEARSPEGLLGPRALLDALGTGVGGAQPLADAVAARVAALRDGALSDDLAVLVIQPAREAEPASG